MLVLMVTAGAEQLAIYKAQYAWMKSRVREGPAVPDVMSSIRRPGTRHTR